MTIYEAFFTGGGICIAIVLFFIYLCKRLSINYKPFLLHSFLGFLGFWGINRAESIINIHIFETMTNVVFKLFLNILGFLLSHGVDTSLFNFHILESMTYALLALCLGITGFLIRQEIISFIFLLIALMFGYKALSMRYQFDKLSEITHISFLSNPIFKTTFAFFIMMSVFLLWSIWHKKYKMQK